MQVSAIAHMLPLLRSLTKLYYFELVLRYPPNRPEPQVPGCSTGSKQYRPLLACGCRTCFPPELLGCNGAGMDIHLIWWTMHGLSWLGVAGVEIWEELEAAIVQG